VLAIKTRIKRETGLTASAGLAANKFIAKVASDLRKPDGLVVVEPGREAEFLAPLPIERLWGVGKATAKELQTLGVATIGQLQRIAPRALVARLGPHGPDLLDLAFGRDDRAVEPFSPPKSMGAETTFEHDCREPARLEETLRYQAERVARELRAEGLAACRVTLKLRWADFRTLTRSQTGDPTQDGLEIYRRAATLLARERLVQAVRLIGVSAPRCGASSSRVPSTASPAASAGLRSCRRACSVATIRVTDRHRCRQQPPMVRPPVVAVSSCSRSSRSGCTPSVGAA
jgi:DNA polymerase-4